MHSRVRRLPPLFALFATAFALVAARASAQGCLPWGYQDDINARLQGAGAVVELCPNAIFELTGSVVFSADGQTLTTEGRPTDDRRAVLRVAVPNLTTAVVMIERNDVELAHLIIDGNRPQLGYREGEALVFAGSVMIVARTRTLLGAIHLVSHGDYFGDFRDVVVRDNVVEADGGLIRIGVASGAPTWGCYPPEQTVESLTSFGATVVDNVLRAGPYHDGFVVDAVRDFTVTGNRAEGTVHRGVPALDCHGRLAAPPAAGVRHDRRQRSVDERRAGGRGRGRGREARRSG